MRPSYNSFAITFTVLYSPAPVTQFQKEDPRAPSWKEQLPSHNQCGMRPVHGPLPLPLRASFSSSTRGAPTPPHPHTPAGSI